MIIWLVIIILLVWFYFKPEKRQLHYGDLIPGPKRWPILGNVFNRAKDSRDDLNFRDSMHAKYGSVWRLWYGNVLIINLCDPRDVEVILKHPKEIEKPYLAYGFIKGWLGSGLILSHDELWALRRKTLAPAFHFKILDKFMEDFNRRASELVDTLTRRDFNEPVDFFKNVTKTTIDVINDTAMGGEAHITDEESTEYKEAVESMSSIAMKRVSEPIFHSDFIWKHFGDSQLEQKYLNTLSSITKKVIREKEKHILSETENHKLIATEEDGYLGSKRKMASLEIMLRLKLDGHPAFKTDSDIIDETNTLFFAGHDTTAATICFTLELLARHQNVQEKLYNEIRELRDADYLKSSDIQGLPYLEMVLKETLRLFPAVPVIGRYIKSELELPSGYTIPANSLVGISIYHTHRHPEFYENPAVFNPENFLPDAMAQRHPYAYIPFSAGLRNCIGKKFAILEAKTILIRVLSNFKILLPKDAAKEIKPLSTLILRNEQGHNYLLQER